MSTHTRTPASRRMPCRSRASLVVFTIALLGTLGGCSLTERMFPDEQPRPDRGAAIVYTFGRAGQPPVQPGGAAFETFLDAAVSDGATLSVVVADGRPRMVDSVATELEGNAAQQKVRRGPLDREIAESLAAATPQTSEADIFAALDLAARSTAGHAERSVLVVDSGISTSGTVAMQVGLLDEGADLGAQVDLLAARGLLPELGGVEVTWVNLGETAGTQPALSIAARKRLVTWWTLVIERGGGELVIEEAPVGGDIPPADAPTVTPVVIDDGPAPTTFTTTIPEGELRFRIHSTEFAEPDSAEAALTAVCDAITDGGYTGLTITGTTSDGGDPLPAQVDLSQRRADAVAVWFREFCLTPLEITARGVGPDFPGRIADRDPVTGRLIEELAAQNRRTIIQAYR